MNCLYFSKIAQGGKVDKSYYLKKNEELSDLTGYTIDEIGRGSSLQVEKEVEEAGSILR